MSGYSWSIESSVPAATASSATPANIYGRDIYLGKNGNAPLTQIAHSGDYLLAEEIDCLAQALYRRTCTRKGEMKLDPGYGVGAGRYVNERDTPANKAALRRDIESQFILDDRVDKVLAVESRRTGATINLLIKVSVRLLRGTPFNLNLAGTV